MESIDQTIDRVFPKTFTAPGGVVTMEDLATIKTGLKKAVPLDTIVELTLFMQTIQLSVRPPGDRWYQRSCQVVVDGVKP